MRVYLAARYSRREELTHVAAELRAMGHVVTSRWLDGSHQLDDEGLSEEAKPALRERFAREDWEDLRSADVCMAFTESPRMTNSRGGRHVEFGAALGMGLRCVCVGYRENVFYCLPEVKWFPNWTQAREWVATVFAPMAVRR